MGEFAGSFDIPAANIADATPFTIEVPISVPAKRWSAYLIPVDGGAATDPSVDMEYKIGDNYYPLNPAASMTAVRNKANIVTREDVINGLKFIVTPGATKFDGDFICRLYIERE
jgi:hypothetical protein